MKVKHYLHLYLHSTILTCVFIKNVFQAELFLYPWKTIFGINCQLSIYKQDILRLHVFIHVLIFWIDEHFENK